MTCYLRHSFRGRESWRLLKVMPDHLPRPDGFQGDTSDDVEKALENEQEWLYGVTSGRLLRWGARSHCQSEKNSTGCARIGSWFLWIASFVHGAPSGWRHSYRRKLAERSGNWQREAFNDRALFVYSGARVQKAPAGRGNGFPCP